MEKIKPNGIKIDEDKLGSNTLPCFGIQTIQYAATVTGHTKMSSQYTQSLMPRKLDKIATTAPSD
jgi:hypothetical protein